MANLITTTVLTLYGDDVPTEVDVQPRVDGSVALFFVATWRGQRLTVAGDPNDVEAFFKNGLDLVQEASASLTVCQRRGRHNYEPSGPEDGCTDCSEEPLAAPVLVATGNVPF